MKILSIILLLAIVPMTPALAASTEQDAVVQAYMLCVRKNAERLEPSGDSPQDIAKASIFLCSNEELAAFAPDPSSATQLRETAIFYGTGQAVVARLCRKAKDCGLAPLK
jgi:hypothetical protein